MGVKPGQLYYGEKVTLEILVCVGGFVYLDVHMLRGVFLMLMGEPSSAVSINVCTTVQSTSIFCTNPSSLHIRAL